MEFKKSSKEDILKDDPLRDYFVWWDEITQKDVKKLQQILKTATKESALQRFFEKNSIFLIQHLGGGHGRWCIPHKRLGKELVLDFLIGEHSSLGFEWYGLELETPKAKLFNKNGDPSAALTHAIRQVTDWRVWLKNNIDYAKRPRDKQGLGLTDIDGNIKCFILIGRRENLNPIFSERRRQMSKDNNIEIHTYDWLIEQAEHRCAALKHKNKKR